MMASPSQCQILMNECNSWTEKDADQVLLLLAAVVVGFCLVYELLIRPAVRRFVPMAFRLNGLLLLGPSILPTMDFYAGVGQRYAKVRNADTDIDPEELPLLQIADVISDTIFATLFEAIAAFWICLGIYLLLATRTTQEYEAVLLNSESTVIVVPYQYYLAAFAFVITGMGCHYASSTLVDEALVRLKVRKARVRLQDVYVRVK